MKIILPLAGFGILSTLFLISRNVDPSKSIPFAQIDLIQRATEQGVTNPAFSGVTQGGDQISFRAKIARPDPEDNTRLYADEVSAQLILMSGATVDISSNNAAIQQSGNLLSLDGDVLVTTTTGYKIVTDALLAKFEVLYAESPGPVSADGPIGKLTAGRMVLDNQGVDGHAQLLFTGGVKLLYELQTTKE